MVLRKIGRAIRRNKGKIAAGAILTAGAVMAGKKASKSKDVKMLAKGAKYMKNREKKTTAQIFQGKGTVMPSGKAAKQHAKLYGGG